MTYVIKRDGSKVKWDSNKIVNAVRKAFESCRKKTNLMRMNSKSLLIGLLLIILVLKTFKI